GFVYFIDDQLEIMQQRDVKTEDYRPLRTYTLQYTSVEDAARMLRAMLPTSQGAGASPPSPPAPRPGGPPAGAAVNPGVTLADVVDIEEDIRADRLIIKATPVKHELIKEYLEKYIDLPLPSEAGNVRIFEIKHGDPNEIVEMIKPLLGKAQQ